ncbi:MAG: PD40 domain-containing protein [Pirellulales bacterium]|nr:PD40 domain-containing protein [Pirellulales bacterium]
MAAMHRAFRRRSSTCATGVIAAVVIAAGWTAYADDLAAELKDCPYRIAYESWQDGNWELLAVHADGSAPVNLTKTPDVNEMYPHASPDGAKIVFVVDEAAGAAKVRNVYCMNLDGSGRRRLAENAREPCWDSQGTVVACLHGESDSFTYTDYATKGLARIDLATGLCSEHPNAGLQHLYNVCWSPDGKWFVSTVHAGMGFKHAILAIEADGNGVYNLGLPGCRPDVSPDGKKVAWGASDWTLRAGDLDFSGPTPQVKNVRDLVASQEPMEVYHVDWSPDGRYVAFSRGPKSKRMGRAAEIVGMQAEGWNICVADAAAANRWTAITSDGKSNKEPDWIPARDAKP